MFVKSIYFEEYGCPSNKFDSEVMKAYIEIAGYSIVDDLYSADVLVMNTCGVKKATEDKIVHRLRFLRDLKKPIVVTGCLPKINRNAIEKAIPEYLALLDPCSIDKIVHAIKGAENDQMNQLFFLEKAKMKLHMPKCRGRIFEIVPISEGCLEACTFCCTRFARGRLYSYPLKAVVNRVKELVTAGIREIWLTAQDTGAYGLDQNYDLVDLLNAILNVRGDFVVRLGMMNPTNVLKMLDRLIDLYKNDKLFKFLHIPVQSGNNKVLKIMNRSYTIDDFKNIVKSFRDVIPNISLSTDIICGFPGEDEKAFEDSLMLIREIEPDVVNVSKFFPRPNTLATSMTQIPNLIVKIRSTRMAKICKAISTKKSKAWLNWEGEILIDEIGKGFSMIGRNFAYKPIVVNGRHNLLGQRLKVKIKEAHPTYLFGELTY